MCEELNPIIILACNKQDAYNRNAENAYSTPALYMKYIRNTQNMQRAYMCEGCMYCEYVWMGVGVV